jgi:hypothetical protein
MGKTLLTYRKGIIAALAVLIPGIDTAASVLENSGIDWPSVVSAALSSDPKVWALPGVIVLMTYLRAQESQEYDDLRKLVEELRQKVNEKG